MSERHAAVKHFVMQEMEGMIAAGQWRSGQSALAECFLPEHASYAKSEMIPPPTKEEVVAVLNGLIRDNKIHFSGLEVIEGKISVWLHVR